MVLTCAVKLTAQQGNYSCDGLMFGRCFFFKCYVKKELLCQLLSKYQFCTKLVVRYDSGSLLHLYLSFKASLKFCINVFVCDSPSIVFPFRSSTWWVTSLVCLSVNVRGTPPWSSDSVLDHRSLPPPSSNLNLGVKIVSSLTSPHYIWRSFGPFSLPCAQKWQ